MSNWKYDPSKPLGPHHLADLLPKPTEEERAILKHDIQTMGLLEPITVFEGMILDGRSRYNACKELGYPFKDRDFEVMPDDFKEPLMFVVSKNLSRRHLTAVQKRDVIKRLLDETPNASSRMIAKLAGVTHPTVESVRQEISTGKINQSKSGAEPQEEEKRVSADGKVRKKPKAKSKQVSAKDLKRQTDKFKSDWEDLNDHQKASFVKDNKEEIAEILENVEAEVEPVAEVEPEGPGVQPDL